MKLHYKKSITKKINASPDAIVALLFIAHILSAICSDILLPALKQMQSELGSTEFMTQMSIIIFYAGAIVSRTVWGAVSDIYGRKTAFIWAIAIQTVTIFPCVYAENIETIILCRFLQSFGSGFISVICIAIVADLFIEKDRPPVYALIDSSYPIGFVLGPVIGAVVSDYFGWQGCFWFIFYSFSLIFIAVLIILPETNKDRTKNSFKKVYKDYFKFFKNRRMLECGAIIGLISGAYMAFVIHAPYIYMCNNNLSKLEFAFFQMTPMVVSFFALLLYRKLVYKHGIAYCLNLGMKGMLIMTVLSSLINFLSSPISPFVSLFIVTGYCSFSQFIVPSLTSKALEVFPQRSGMSSSVLSSLRSMFMLLCMLVTGYFVASEAKQIFNSISVIIMLTMFLLLSMLNRYVKIEDK